MNRRGFCKAKSTEIIHYSSFIIHYSFYFFAPLRRLTAPPLPQGEAFVNLAPNDGQTCKIMNFIVGRGLAPAVLFCANVIIGSLREGAHVGDGWRSLRNCRFRTLFKTSGEFIMHAGSFRLGKLGTFLPEEGSIWFVRTYRSNLRYNPFNCRGRRPRRPKKQSIIAIHWSSPLCALKSFSMKVFCATFFQKSGIYFTLFL